MNEHVAAPDVSSKRQRSQQEFEFFLENAVQDLTALATGAMYMKQDLGPSKAEGEVSAMLGMIVERIYQLEEAWEERYVPPELRVVSK